MITNQLHRREGNTLVQKQYNLICRPEQHHRPPAQQRSMFNPRKISRSRLQTSSSLAYGRIGPTPGVGARPLLDAHEGAVLGRKHTNIPTVVGCVCGGASPTSCTSSARVRCVHGALTAGARHHGLQNVAGMCSSFIQARIISCSYLSQNRRLPGTVHDRIREKM